MYTWDENVWILDRMELLVERPDLVEDRDWPEDWEWDEENYDYDF